MFDKILNIDKNPKIVKFAQTAVGKLLMIGIFALFVNHIGLYVDLWLQAVVIVILLSSFIPQYRHAWLFVGMLFLLQQHILNTYTADWLLFKVNYLDLSFENQDPINITSQQIKFFNIFVTILLSEILVFLMRRYRQVTVLRYPITLSYTFVLILILIASYAPLPKIAILYLWSFISIYTHYFWFVGYTFLESRLTQPRDFLLDYGRYLPVWGFTALPYGKGSLYLKQIESRTSEDLAITQLKGLKLAYWAFLLFLISQGVDNMGNYFQIPSLDTALYDYAGGHYYSFYRAWVCLFYRFFREMLLLTIMGHTIIAACRMCGFRALRNTYKPLGSQTIAEFWNRYNYYFKELLVGFFFYPTYFRFFATRPKLRIFFATFAAATFGNILFHFLLLVPTIMSYGFSNAWHGFIPYCCYAIVLGFSIGCSQLYNKSRSHQNKNKFLRYILSPVIVIAFYSILGLFNQPYQAESVLINLKFFGSLFNIRW